MLSLPPTNSGTAKAISQELKSLRLQANMPFLIELTCLRPSVTGQKTDLYKCRRHACRNWSWLSSATSWVHHRGVCSPTSLFPFMEMEVSMPSPETYGRSKTGYCFESTLGSYFVQITCIYWEFDVHLWERNKTVFIHSGFLSIAASLTQGWEQHS